MGWYYRPILADDRYIGISVYVVRHTVLWKQFFLEIIMQKIMLGVIYNDYIPSAGYCFSAQESFYTIKCIAE